MDNLADNNDSDVEIQVYSKSNSEANVMAIMEITFEVAMQWKGGTIRTMQVHNAR